MAETLLELIQRGALAPRTKLRHTSRRSGFYGTVEAQVVPEGIKVGSRVFKSPSAAAKSITGKPVDGWLFWRLPSGAYLSSLRTPEVKAS